MSWYHFVIRYAFAMAVLVLMLSISPSWLKPPIFAMIFVLIIAPFLNPHRIWRRMAALCTSLLIPHAGAKLNFEFSFLKKHDQSKTEAALSFLWDNALDSDLKLIILAIVIFVLADLIQNFPELWVVFKGAKLKVCAVDERTRFIQNKNGNTDAIVICRIENNTNNPAPIDGATLYSFFKESTETNPRVEISKDNFLHADKPILAKTSKLVRLDFFDISNNYLNLSKKIPNKVRSLTGLDVWAGTVKIKVANQNIRFRVRGKLDNT